MAISVNEETMDIAITRGDTGKVRVEVIVDDEHYDPKPGDIVRFSLKKNVFSGEKYKHYVDPEPLIEKIIPNDTLVLEIEPEDTKPYDFGLYAYNLELIWEDGTVDTFVKAKFRITEETN